MKWYSARVKHLMWHDFPEKNWNDAGDPSLCESGSPPSSSSLEINSVSLLHSGALMPSAGLCHLTQIPPPPPHMWHTNRPRTSVRPEPSLHGLVTCALVHKRKGKHVQRAHLSEKLLGHVDPGPVATGSGCVWWGMREQDNGLLTVYFILKIFTPVWQLQRFTHNKKNTLFLLLKMWFLILFDQVSLKPLVEEIVPRKTAV